MSINQSYPMREGDILFGTDSAGVISHFLECILQIGMLVLGVSIFQDNDGTEMVYWHWT